MKKLFITAVAVLAFSAISCAKKVQQNGDSNSSQTNNSEQAESGKTQTGEADSKAPVFEVKKIAENIQGKKIVEAIKKQYPGKVVLFDFWATWCGPCRAAMKSIDEIKPELQKKGAVFVYVTGETSPKSDWEDMIPNIPGKHYRLTERQWGTLGIAYNMVGIPAYLLLNKDGSEAFSNISEGGYPGSDLLKSEIEKALAK